MGEVPFQVLTRKVFGLVRSTFTQISAINKKYATAHIRTTVPVRVALLLLRLYLLSLVGVLIFKFVTMLR
jgi:hypothetical protein